MMQSVTNYKYMIIKQRFINFVVKHNDDEMMEQKRNSMNETKRKNTHTTWNGN